MNILIPTTSYPSSAGDSCGLFVHHLAKALIRRGHTIRVVVPARPDALTSRKIEGVQVFYFRYALRAAGHKLTAIEGGIPEALRRHKLAFLQIPTMTTCFALAIRKHLNWADIIHANWLGSGLAGALAGIGKRTPMVITLRGDDTYLIHKKPVWRFIARRIFNRCKTVTAVSANMIKLLDPVVPQRIQPVIVPTFGVDTELFNPGNPSDSPRSDNKICGLFVGNISHAKGVDVLLRALAKCPNTWHKFALAGHGPDLDHMQQLAVELGIHDRLDWLGRLAATEVPPTMRRYDFLVLPSLSEGRPNVITEALASGLPSIATTVGGIPELIEHEKTGLLVKPGNDEDLARAIRLICENTELRQKIAAQSRRHIEAEDLTWDRTAREFETIFQQAYAKTPGDSEHRHNPSHSPNNR